MLAVGLFRGWRPALAGTALAALVLAAIVLVLGTAVDSFPVADAQVVVGMFLLLFGLRWLHKAILRQAGLKALHDEAEEFEATKQVLSTREHWVALTTAFNGVLLEGVEVVLIVIALGGVGHRVGAAVGATAALLAVVVAGVVLRAPLTRIPENLMKASVGVMLTSFGVFFVGEGIGVHWWHEDVSILVLVALFATLFVALLVVPAPSPRRACPACGRRRRGRDLGSRRRRWDARAGGRHRRARCSAARRAGGRRGGLGRTAARCGGRHGAPRRGRRLEAA